MTNGEKIQKDFKGCEVCEPIVEDDIIHVIFADKKDSAIGFDWSWWNAEYKEPTTKNDLGVDLISRNEVLNGLASIAKIKAKSDAQKSLMGRCMFMVERMPPVTPQPRKGHWIIDTHKIRAFGKKYETHDYSVHCDKCNYAWDYTTDKVGSGSLVSNFCPNCGAKMEIPIDDMYDWLYRFKK